jgi:hypothetical protein
VLFILFIPIGILLNGQYRTYIGISHLFLGFNLAYAYITGYRKSLTASRKKVLDLFIGLTVLLTGLYNIYLYSGMFIYTILALLFCWVSLLIAFNLAAKYLFLLGIILVVGTPLIQFVSLPIAEYLNVLTFYALLLGVSNLMFFDFIYHSD